jgi:hypothetical protein
MGAACRCLRARPGVPLVPFGRPVRPIVLACPARNARQVSRARLEAGSMPASLRICHTVDGASLYPSPVSSPWMRRYPSPGCPAPSPAPPHGSPAPCARPSRTAPRICLPPLDQVGVPAQQGPRRDDQAHLAEAARRQHPGQRGQDRPVSPGQPGCWSMALENCELVAQDEDLGVLSTVGAGEQAPVRSCPWCWPRVLGCRSPHRPQAPGGSRREPGHDLPVR